METTVLLELGGRVELAASEGRGRGKTRAAVEARKSQRFIADRLPAVVGGEGQPELGRVGECIGEHGRDRELLVRGRGGDEHDQEAESLEEDAEDLRTVPQPGDDEVERVDRDVEHGRQRPAADRPAGQEEDGQRDQQHDAAGERRQQVIRLRARAEHGRRHQSDFP
jgi:hypothetical protein